MEKWGRKHGSAPTFESAGRSPPLPPCLWLISFHGIFWTIFYPTSCTAYTLMTLLFLTWESLVYLLSYNKFFSPNLKHTFFVSGNLANIIYFAMQFKDQ